MDDIDHLGNRRVRAVGELLENQFIDGMHVNYQGDDEMDGIECPICKYEVARNDDYAEMRPKYCPECGTKLIY